MQQQLRISSIQDWASDFNIPCDYHPQNKQLYICIDKSCPQHNETYYCEECSDEKHFHKRQSIEQELEVRMQQWQALIGNINQLVHILQENYTKIKPLVMYLDSEDRMKTDLNV